MIREAQVTRSALRDFLRSEAAGGMLLVGAAAAAVIIANSAASGLYHDLLSVRIGPELSPKLGPMTPHLWINDGLMAIFFLLVGLEIKREFVDGRLSSWGRRRLPVIAAASGMAIPAAFYLLLVAGVPGLARGWAIPAATDIAFAIGVLALLGSRAPTSLKLFLTTVAIADDVGAVAVIALAYTDSLNWLAIGVAAGLMLIMCLMARRGMRRLRIYLLLAAGLWYAVLLSGVHATIAGVLAAMVIPIVPTPGTPDSPDSPLHRLEHALSGPVAYVILPLFGFANAGVTLGGHFDDYLATPLPVAIALGLFLGKQLGVFGAVWLCVRLGIGSKLRGATWLQIYGVCLLCGIGFTMSLFIGGLAFPHSPERIDAAKLGILLGSLISAVAGYAVLRLAPRDPSHAATEAAEWAEIDADGDVAN
jgi:NhaA family Na+:H+ antiporter